jgi:hypothetical protein
VNSPSSTPDDASTAFHDYAEAEAAATVRALITQAAKPALTELEALRVAIDVRCESLAATLAGAATTDPAPIRQLVDRLAHAAGEEAGAAARAARTLALEEAEARLQLDRLEARKQLDAMRAEAAEERTASQLERTALAAALDNTARQADAVRAERDAHLQALHREREQAEAIRADRDAQLAALRAAQEQADALRADRDAQLAALRGAQEQADALCADRDAQLAALRAAQEQADALRADRDAQIDAVNAAAEQVAAMSAERDVHHRTAESAREEAQRVQGEQDALLEAARISNARHTRLLEQAHARAEAAQAEAAAARAQAAEAQAHFAAAQAHLAAVQEELAVAQAEAERRLAVGASEIEALRLELERVRANMQAARESARVEPEQPFAAMALPDVAVPGVTVEPVVEPEPAAFAAFEIAATEREPAVEPVPSFQPVFETPIEAASEPVIEFVGQPVVESVSEPAVEFVNVPAVEFASEPEVAAVAEPAPDWQAVHLVEHTSQTEPAVAIATIAEPEPIRDAVEADPVRAIYRAIDGAADLSQVLDALVDGVGVLFPRAALFVVKTKSKRLQGWRSVGFTGVAAITREFEFPLTTDSALTRAVTASRTIFTGDGQSAQSAEAWTVTFPVTTGGRVVAVVHADGGAPSGDPVAAFDRDTALDLGHTLVRMAGERIGALTMSARAAFGNVMNVAPADTTPEVAPMVTSTPAHVTPINIHSARVNGTHVNGSHTAPQVAVVPETAAAAIPDAAVLVASQLISELNRYGQAATAPPADERLQERLAGQIEGARTQAPAPAEPAASALGLFDEALGKMLGNGALDQAPAAIQTF